MSRLRYGMIIILICVMTLAGCDLPGLGGSTQGKKNIKVSALATSESQIMAYMIKDLIEHDSNKYNVSIINNLGSATIQHNALLNGQADISSTRYTGTELVGALHQKPIRDPKKAMSVTQRLFDKKYNQTFFDSYGFENTFAFMVTEETAKKYHLETVSDLDKVKDKIRVGTDTTWIKRGGDGYRPFTHYYGFKFKQLKPMQIGLVYDALKSNKLDAALGYTTDGRVSAYHLKVLKDDKHFFPSYDASAIVPKRLQRQEPEVRQAVKKLEGQISTEQMQQLNYEADGKGKEPAVVAHDFLEKHHYFNK
ncbi:osmoprotectant ABC transporter substrate-binding protein [Staphylococcus pettenkoferi]|uniref:Osmoprotectant ABC transporter substrate-binding protein n=1 Tax=Staphylococcus pettenkoferi TaxID=170573 RepID=A0ABT4BII2_9STAP|nr:osmoprotectant ABC transporter substrate-binding protein [Staphylococcus pettenkoferi]MCY1563725.1 osmoprotectant ABC transporter substrate-binding protein [Staphylococcus pettenkoferi]MCY1570775.1 osmoprotectant ABC transporter substrate-binding protein [Staphylococcus pettenkoferi]MCY1581949.1 osmoprotectant ABC transporter substrate-binding protein [Staphylococcus pettenkoferi]MCY1589812.1 osmoprotectant ABC transporter substrate-binding protein [Staphylococcus pettenkoferi]MCY1591671.1 